MYVNSAMDTLNHSLTKASMYLRRPEYELRDETDPKANGSRMKVSKTDLGKVDNDQNGCASYSWIPN